MADTQPQGLHQPLLGTVALVITVGLSLVFCALFATATLETWVVLLFANAVPAMVIMDMGLHLEFPAVMTRVSRPVRALLFVVIAVLCSAVVSTLLIRFLGGGVTPPNPFVVLFAVQSVPVTLVLVILFRSWPFTALTRSKGLIGLGTFLLTYLITWVLYRVFFDFGFLKGAPVYLEKLDPKGLFNAWQSSAFIVALAAVLLLFLLYEFWPLTILIERRPSLGKEPAFGVLAGGLALLVTLVLWGIPVGLAGMDPVVFMVRVTLALIFGVFVVVTLFQGAGFGKLKQPLKGIAMTVVVVVVAVLAQVVYGIVAKRVDPQIVAGPPGYALELWLATAWMAVTFPVIVVFCGALGFWPLTRRKEADVSAQAQRPPAPDREALKPVADRSSSGI